MTMDPNEITKVIDGVYKNIMENFNPSSRHMIATGKVYLKALHGASAACSMYLDAMVKLSRQAQQSSLGCSGDIGSSLMQVTEVFKEIHTQQLNTLKAFYVDFLVPLETNLEKDTRVIQNEQKKFLMCHKTRIEGFTKASANVKKMKKKAKKCSSSTTIDKEIKIMQQLEEEKAKLEMFCEKSLNEALTQERRRYGFILERQASLAKHYLAFYSKGNSLLNQKLEGWMKISKSREILPEPMQNTLLKRIQKGSEEDCIYCSPRRPADDTVSISSQLRKTKSMEASEIINVTSTHIDLPMSLPGMGTLSRAKSDLNLMMNGLNDNPCHGHRSPSPYSRCSDPQHHGGSYEVQTINNQYTRPKSLAVTMETSNCGVVKALYAYLSSGDNQLCFLEGDIIALIGERSKGWQFGENLRTQKTGWFPVAYTESSDSSSSSPMLLTSGCGSGSAESHGRIVKSSPPPPPMPPPGLGLMTQSASFNQKRLTIGDGLTKSHHVHERPESMLISKSHQLVLKSPTTPIGQPMNNISTSTQTTMMPTNTVRASDSLHSSNDSGFSNDMAHNHHHLHHQMQQQQLIPPQPEVDYSDDDQTQLSNSGTLKSGDKWLMDRYHKSESARIGHQVVQTEKGPQRSLSFINISEITNDDEEAEREDLPRRGRPLHRQNTTLIYPRNHEFSKNGQKGREDENSGGALKKLLNRTRSLIWKPRGTSPPIRSHRSVGLQRHERQNYPPQSVPFDSMSAVGSCFSDLWGSHTSIVELDLRGTNHPPPYETKENGGLGDKSELHERHSEHLHLGNNGFGHNNKIVHEGHNLNVGHKTKHSCQQSEVRKMPPNKPAPPPIPPPLPSRENMLRRHAHNEHHSPIRSSSEEKENRTDISTSQTLHVHPGHYENSGLVRKTKKNQQSIPIIELDKNTDMSIHGSIRRTESEKIRRGHQTHRVFRVESFSGSEAPIVPSRNTHGRGRHGSSSTNRLRQQQKIRMLNGSFGRRQQQNISNRQTNGHRYITSKASIASENYEDDEDVPELRFNLDDNGDEFVDDGASSIFIEPEIEEEDEETLPSPPPPVVRTQSVSGGQKRRTTNGMLGNSKGSLRLLGGRVKSQSLRIVPIGHTVYEARNGAVSPVPSVSKMSSIGDTEELTVARSNSMPQNRRPRRFKGSIRSEFHTVELIATDSDGGVRQLPLFEYGNQIHKRLYYPERSSRMDQKSERTGNLCGPWYDLWGVDPSVSVS